MYESLEFWSNLCPNQSISTGPCSSIVQAPRAVKAPSSMLHHEGYLQWENVLSLEETKELCDCITAVKQATRFPVFCFVYDSFWSIVPRLQVALSEVFEEAWVVLPNFWAWLLEPSERESGWPPHRDREHGIVQPDGRSDALTLWFALTEATPENGCMYVVPAYRDPSYHQKIGHYSAIDSLQDIQALPLKAGSLLAWTPQLLHWGGRCHPQAVQPRISLGYEVQRASIPALDIPLLQPNQRPDFPTRLALIARQLHQYRDMYSMDAPLQRWTRLWHKKLPKRSFWERMAQRAFSQFAQRL